MLLHTLAIAAARSLRRALKLFSRDTISASIWSCLAELPMTHGCSRSCFMTFVRLTGISANYTRKILLAPFLKIDVMSAREMNESGDHLFLSFPLSLICSGLILKFPFWEALRTSFFSGWKTKNRKVLRLCLLGLKEIIGMFQGCVCVCVCFGGRVTFISYLLGTGSPLRVNCQQTWNQLFSWRRNCLPSFFMETKVSLHSPRKSQRGRESKQVTLQVYRFDNIIADHLQPLSVAAFRDWIEQ